MLLGCVELPLGLGCSRTYVVMMEGMKLANVYTGWSSSSRLGTAVDSAYLTTDAEHSQHLLTVA